MLRVHFTNIKCKMQLAKLAKQSKSQNRLCSWKLKRCNSAKADYYLTHPTVYEDFARLFQFI